MQAFILVVAIHGASRMKCISLRVTFRAKAVRVQFLTGEFEICYLTCNVQKM